MNRETIQNGRHNLEQVWTSYTISMIIVVWYHML